VNAGVLPPSTAELNLLLEWPQARTRSQWAGIYGASIALHLLFFFAAARIPSLVTPEMPERRVVPAHVTLYLPKNSRKKLRIARRFRSRSTWRT
jgi:hypothetical protein